MNRFVNRGDFWLREICAAVALRRYPTLAAMKLRLRWGTQSMGGASGVVEKRIPRAALRNDKQKRQQQIPPLRCGMTKMCAVYDKNNAAG